MMLQYSFLLIIAVIFCTVATINSSHDDDAYYSLNLSHATFIAKTAEDYAKKIGLSVSIAICDAGGHALTFRRMDGASPLSAKIVEAKAVGSALFNRDGAVLESIYRNNFGFFTQVDKLAPLPLIPGKGGRVIRGPQGFSLGAIGVGGGTADQDDEIAKYALDFFYNVSSTKHR